MNPMKTVDDRDLDEPVIQPSLSFWRKLGGGSLSISLIVHAALLAIGVIWIFQKVPAPAPEPYISGGGGGSPGSPSVSTQVKRSKSVPLPSQVVAVGVKSNLVKPEVDFSVSEISKGGALSGGSLVGTLGTGGNGAGSGGPGFTNGPPGPGLGDSGLKLFGLTKPNKDALVGSFYDTKQDPKRRPTDMTADQLREVIRDFTKRGWNERSLESRYYKAPAKLYQTKLYIPEMSAEGAPKAFNCEKEVQASRWIVIYRGMVTPPKTGKYRFVGAGDDVLVVRFNKQHVFDHGFTQGTTGLIVPSHLDFLTGKKEDRDLAKVVRDGPMKLPVTFYPYETTRNWNGTIGGLAVGAEFEANAGMTYPIEILVSEVPGGLFGASLLIQETGVTYSKSGSGSPILPLFRLDDSFPAKTDADNAPPYDPQGPIWKLAPGSASIDL